MKMESVSWARKQRVTVGNFASQGYIYIYIYIYIIMTFVCEEAQDPAGHAASSPKPSAALNDGTALIIAINNGYY